MHIIHQQMYNINICFLIYHSYLRVSVFISCSDMEHTKAHYLHPPHPPVMYVTVLRHKKTPRVTICTCAVSLVLRRFVHRYYLTYSRTTCSTWQSTCLGLCAVRAKSSPLPCPSTLLYCAMVSALCALLCRY
jgi:hypothetical protein